ncbi:MAG: hypothetical protein OEY26_11635 [Nitrospinota bacterium]|jgi:hypothetical protein|nr:hypothetical protein [Nitrospinota bacterium]MDH5789689.1 hypothetical protein [Nitrospinota bacterium]
MESLDYHQIKGYCREAQEISDEYGIDDGLSYLIGEKFCPLVVAVKQAESKTKYLYNSEEEDALYNPAGKNDSAVQESYSLAVGSTYQRALERLDDLKQLRDDFISEIKEAFELSDIQDFLESYPRLGFKDKKQPFWEQALEEEDADTLEIEDVLSEVDDIFMVEEIKKYFR